MALKIRLARAGTKKRPYYHIVIAAATSPRDGKYIDVIGAFNPMLAKTDENRVKLDGAKAAEWLKKGAQPTDRVLRFLDKAGLKKRDACLMANHGQIAVAATCAKALELAEEVELLAEQYWKVLAIGKPRLLDDDEMERVQELFKGYGQNAQQARERS